MTGPGLPIIGTALAGIERAFWRVPQIFRASWLHYVLGTVALVILEAFWWGQLGMDRWAPDWLRTLLWGLVITPAILSVIRILWLEPVPAHLAPDWRPYAWCWGAVVITVWSVAVVALDGYRFEIFKLIAAVLGIDIVDRASGPILARLGAAYELARIVIKGFIAVVAMGLLCSIAVDRAVGISHWARWRTAAPIRLLLLGVLTEAALDSLRLGDGIVLSWWRTVDPPPLSMLPWRSHFVAMLRLELIALPAVFVSNVLSSAILVEGYRRLAGGRTA